MPALHSTKWPLVMRLLTLLANSRIHVEYLVRFALNEDLRASEGSFPGFANRVTVGITPNSKDRSCYCE
jgi:hypothetical protein